MSTGSFPDYSRSIDDIRYPAQPFRIKDNELLLGTLQDKIKDGTIQRTKHNAYENERHGAVPPQVLPVNWEVAGTTFDLQPDGTLDDAGADGKKKWKLEFDPNYHEAAPGKKLIDQAGLLVTDIAEQERFHSDLNAIPNHIHGAAREYIQGKFYAENGGIADRKYLSSWAGNSSDRLEVYMQHGALAYNPDITYKGYLDCANDPDYPNVYNDAAKMCWKRTFFSQNGRLYVDDKELGMIWISANGGEASSKECLCAMTQCPKGFECVEEMLNGFLQRSYCEGKVDENGNCPQGYTAYNGKCYANKDISGAWNKAEWMNWMGEYMLDGLTAENIDQLFLCLNLLYPEGNLPLDTWNKSEWLNWMGEYPIDGISDYNRLFWCLNLLYPEGLNNEQQ